MTSYDDGDETPFEQLHGQKTTNGETMIRRHLLDSLT